jgi:hypothetical protein
MSEVENIPLGDGEDEVEVTFNDEDPKSTPTVEKVTSAKPEEGADGEGDGEEDDLKKHSKAVQKRISRLTYEARENERQRDEAVKIAAAFKEENDQLKKRSLSSDKSLTVEYENRLKAQETNIKRDLRAAIENGDSDAQTNLQSELGALAVEKEKVRVAKLNIERYEREHPEGEKKEKPVVTEQAAPQVRPDPKAQAWAEKNEWFGTDTGMTNTAFVFHKTMEEEGDIELGSPDYYKELDRRMALAYPSKYKKAKEVDGEEVTTTERRTTTQTVAGGRPAQPSNAGKNKVKLTQSQVAIARRLGVSLEDYASQLRILSK